MRYGDDAKVELLERLRRRLAHAEDKGWFFAAIADQVAERRTALGLSQQDLAGDDEAAR